jgi:hypothetical protein
LEPGHATFQIRLWLANHTWVVLCKPHKCRDSPENFPPFDIVQRFTSSAGIHWVNTKSSFIKIMWWWGNSVKFDPDQDIGDLAEKVILVTGGMLAFHIT